MRVQICAMKMEKWEKNVEKREIIWKNQRWNGTQLGLLELI